MSSIQENINRIRGEIEVTARRAGRDPSEITLVAVSKKKPLEAIFDAVKAGQHIFGENYVQEAASKIKAAVHDGLSISWHFIGHLQRNKAKAAVELFDVIETVDSLRLLKAVNRYAVAADRVISVLLQVNIAGEENKSGMAPEDMEHFLEQVQKEHFPGVRIQGMMIMPPWCSDPEDARPWFRAARTLRDRLSERFGGDIDLRHLSMGMSGDFRVAVEEGATIVRIGTALFGAR